MDAVKLFEYSQVLRDRFLECVASLPWSEVVKSRGASFDSFRGILLHTIDAEDNLVNCDIAGRRAGRVSRKPEEFLDMASIRKCAEEVESGTKAYVVSMKPEDLERKVEIQRFGAPSIWFRMEDVLVHCALENLCHYGEVIALLWQIDVEPPYKGWLG
jgi:uncharacterized damage-inducible protein DinB